MKGSNASFKVIKMKNRVPEFAKKIGFAVVLIGGFTTSSHAARDLTGVSVSLEPIVGYELQRKEDPTRTKLVLTYGARVVAGYKILSAELEYTQGKSNDRYADTATEIEEKTQNVRLGVRSTFSIASMLDWYLRGGAEAQKRHITRTVSGITTERDAPSKVYPYLGTGMYFRLGSQISLNASVLTTIKDTSNLNKNEYTTAFGVNVNFNAR